MPPGHAPGYACGVPPLKTSSAAAWLIAAILCAVAPAAGWLSWQAHDDVRREREAVDASLRRAAAALAEAAEAELASSMQALKVLSLSGFFQQDRVGSLGRLLHGQPRRDWDSVVVIDRSGAVVIDTAPAPIAAAELPRLRQLHRDILARKAPGVFRPGPETAKGSVMLAVPVLQDGRVRYVLGARVADATWLFLAAAAEKPDGASAVIVDERGHAVAATGGQWPGAVTGALATPLASHYFASHTIPTAGWQARITLPAEPVDARLRARLFDALLPAGLSLLAGFVLALVVGWRLVRAR